MAFGVTEDGFVAKTVADIKTGLEAGFRGVIGQIANVDPRSRNGQLIALFSNALSDVWELGEALGNAFNPNAAGGLFLENLLALVGQTKLPATATTVDAVATGTAGTVVASGKRFSVPGTTTKIELQAGVTLVAVTAWANTTAYVVGDRRKNGGNIYQCITAGTSAGSGGPTGTDTDITDGTVHWTYLGAGAAAVDITDAEVTETGPTPVYARTATAIDTPVSGWQGVMNLLDGEIGRNLETDAEARLRRLENLAALGTSSVPALYSELINVEGVSFLAIFENPTDATVGNLTPHSIEVLADGPFDDNEMLQAIFDAKAGGIETIGTTSGAVSDSEGIPHTIRFSRPSALNVYSSPTVHVNVADFPSDGADQIKAALVAWGNAQKNGRNVVSSAQKAEIFRAIPGILDVPVCYIGTSSSPATETTIVLQPRQKAAYDTSRIVVTVVTGDF
jgi:hypothetical protein